MQTAIPNVIVIRLKQDNDELALVIKVILI